jgi:DNA-binding CsgD family transcriptional regulator
MPADQVPARLTISDHDRQAIRARKSLTARQLQVLRGLVGTIDKFDTLAASLNMSVDTFDTHWREVRRKMDIPTYTGQQSRLLAVHMVYQMVWRMEKEERASSPCSCGKPAQNGQNLALPPGDQ